MDKYEELRSRIVVSDEKLEQIKAKFRVLNMAENANLYIAALARLAHAAGTVDDFDLAGININADTSSFRESSMKAVLLGYDVFFSFDEHMRYMKRLAKARIINITPMIQNVNDTPLCKIYASEVGKCTLYFDSAKRHESKTGPTDFLFVVTCFQDMFNSVLALVAEEYVRYMLTKPTTNDQIIESLDGVRKQLKGMIMLCDFWVKFLTRANTYFQDFAELCSIQLVDKLDTIAKQITKIFTDGVLVYSLADAYSLQKPTYAQIVFFKMLLDENDHNKCKELVTTFSRNAEYAKRTDNIEKLEARLRKGLEVFKKD